MDTLKKKILQKGNEMSSSIRFVLNSQNPNNYPIMRFLPVLWLIFFGISCNYSTPPLSNKNISETPLAAVFQDFSKVQQFHLDNSKDTVLRSNNKMLLAIEPNTWVDAEGKNVSENIVLELQEFYNQQEIILAGLHTRIADGFLSTGGMFYINAKTESGKLLKIAPDKSIAVSQSLPAGMELYEGVADAKGAIQWANPQQKEDRLTYIPWESFIRFHELIWAKAHTNHLYKFCDNDDRDTPKIFKRYEGTVVNTIEFLERDIWMSGFQIVSFMKDDLSEKHSLHQIDSFALVCYMRDTFGQAAYLLQISPSEAQAMRKHTKCVTSLLEKFAEESKGWKKNTKKQLVLSKSVSDSLVMDLINSFYINEDYLYESEYLLALCKDGTCLTPACQSFRKTISHFQIKSTGYFNFDKLLNLPQIATSVKLQLQNKDSLIYLRSYLFYPDYNVFVPIDIDANHVASFRAVEGSAVVYAIGCSENQFYFAKETLILKDEETYNLSLLPMDKKELYTKIEGLSSIVR